MREDGPEARAVVALGSNLGDRWGFLTLAIRGLCKGAITPLVLSPVFETPPLGPQDQPPYLNLVAMGPTRLEANELLAVLQSLEAEAGRVRTAPNAPRTLDLDLLFFKGRIIREENLRVPHPRWRNRSFVVQPLLHLAPWLRDPETGLTVEEVARFWRQEPEVIREVEPGYELPFGESKENEGR